MEYLFTGLISLDFLIIHLILSVSDGIVQSANQEQTSQPKSISNSHPICPNYTKQNSSIHFLSSTIVDSCSITVKDCPQWITCIWAWGYNNIMHNKRGQISMLKFGCPTEWMICQFSEIFLKHIPFPSSSVLLNKWMDYSADVDAHHSTVVGSGWMDGWVDEECQRRQPSSTSTTDRQTDTPPAPWPNPGPVERANLVVNDQHQRFSPAPIPPCRHPIIIIISIGIYIGTKL